MADLVKFAEELAGATSKEVQECLKVLEEDYGIVPARFEKAKEDKRFSVLPRPFVDRRYNLLSKRKNDV